MIYLKKLNKSDKINNKLIIETESIETIENNNIEKF